MSDPQLPPVLRFMMAARRCELLGLQSLAATCELVVAVSRLVHALQKERGYSNLYLSNHLARCLPLLDGHSDDARAMEREVRGRFSEMDLEGGAALERARLFNRIAHVLHGLDELPALRRRIREQDVQAGEATAVLTRLIGGLLGVVFEAADMAVDPPLARRLVALFNFMQGKELAGQERAIGVVGFAQGHFQSAALEQLRHLQEGQARAFESFLEFASEPARRAWEKLLEEPTLGELQRLRELATRISAQSPLDSGLGELWFDLATRRIDAMKLIENDLATDLRSSCRQSIDEAAADLESHRALLKRFAALEAGGGQAVLFSLQGSSLDTAPPDGVGNQLGRSLLDLMQEQTQRLQQANDDLRQARQRLDERKRLERAKALLMREYRLSEAQAHQRLQQAAMSRGLSLVEVADGLLEQMAPKR
ncbi:nitrate- and nitrite sensing domain-containing protein [Pseudomonas sp. NCHU5208]|uniref:nitrate- and nitrite sensing domain-containing protein n=1 Tax=unclassified Pseudomonas TaxID=196821 RepID=UPI003F9BF59D